MLDELSQTNPEGTPFTLEKDTSVQATLVGGTTIRNGHVILQVDVGTGDFRDTPLTQLARERMERYSLQVGTYRWKFNANHTDEVVAIHTTYDV